MKPTLGLPIGWRIGLLALVVTTEALGTPVSPAPYQAIALDTLRELVEINSAEPFGSLGAASAIARRLLSAGFSASDISLLAPGEHPEKANLVVRLRGRGKGKPLLWTGHLDVVEADAGDWSVPPYTLSDRDGWYYGRGTGDMKGENAALVVSLIRLKAEGFVPLHDLVVAFTADEEAAGHVDGVRWLLATHRSLLDAGIAFNPDGGGGGMLQGRRLYFGVQTAEKTYASFTLTVTNKGGHSSQPERENAIYRLSSALIKVSAYRFPFHLTATTRAYLTVDAGFEPEPTRRDIESVLSTPPADAAVERLSARPDLNSKIRTTCVATLLSAGSAENALPQRAQATLQCRLLPGERSDAVLQALQALIADPQVKIALVRPVTLSPETAPDPRVVDTVTRVVDSLWPRLPVLVTMDAGGSDAVFTRGAGIPTYGIASISDDIEDDRHHGRDERILKSAFYEGVELTYRLMKGLDAQLPGY
jgi:acetylornithine deacetylase/succinyl-diaminopimelate desuccinylase-like protein